MIDVVNNSTEYYCEKFTIYFFDGTNVVLYGNDEFLDYEINIGSNIEITSYRDSELYEIEVYPFDNIINYTIKVATSGF